MSLTADQADRFPRFRTPTRVRAGAFHPEIRTLSRVLPGRAVSGPRTLRLLRWAEGRKPQSARLDVRSCGPCDVVIVRPASASPQGLLLWVHGGGLVLGRGHDDPPMLRRLADDVDAVVVSVDYRRPPEHPFPVAIEDCYAALTWAAGLQEHAELPVAVAGGSAGAGLAAALALVARDRQEVQLRGQVLIYPMLDDRTAAAPDPGHAVRRLWDNVANELGWRSYLGQPPGSPDVSPYAAAARAGDLSGLPPTWIGVGTLDLFHDEDVTYARRLREAGVPCELEVVDGAFHGFDLAGRTEVATRFRASYVAALRTAFTSRVG